MAAQPKIPSSREKSRATILEELSARDWRALRNQAQRNSLSAGEAEDALQDGCVQFLRFYDGLASGAMPWLQLVVKRCAWAIGARARQRGAHTHVVTTVDFEDAAESEVIAIEEGLGPEELAERTEALQQRIELLGQLKPDERTTLILIGLGASYREIGELRGWSLTKINRCASEGRARLRELASRGEK